jgi:hypothetical protein
VVFEDVLPESWLPTFLGKFVQCKSRLCFEMVTKSNQYNVKKWFIPVRIDPQYVPYSSFFYQNISKNQKEINLKTDWKRMLLLNDCYKTVSSHFFAICMLIFHKTEAQTVILICSMGLNFNWFNRYDLKGSLRPNTTLANSQKNSN